MDSNGVKYDKTSMELESVEFLEFLEFVTLKKVHKESKGPEKRGSESPIETKSRLSSRTIGPGETGYWEPNRNKKHGSAAKPSSPEKQGIGSPIETKSRLSSRTVEPRERGYWEPNRSKKK